MTELLLILLSVLVYGVAVLSVLLTEGRKPTATLSWLLSIVLLPVVGLVLYLLIGRTRTPRVLARRKDLRPRLELLRERLEGDLATRAPAGDLRTEIMIELGRRLATIPASGGNAARMLVNGGATYRSMLEAIEAAEDHIHVEFYIIQPDEVGQALRRRLTRRAGEGIEVRVLYDAVGSSALPGGFWNALTEAGGQVAVFNPVSALGYRMRRRDRVDFRNHRKLLIIDGRVGFTGGINVGREYLGLDPEQGRWRDTHMKIEGPAVLGLQQAFVEDWFGASDELPHGTRYFPELQSPNSGCTVQIVDSGPDRGFSPMESYHVQAIALSTQRVWLTTPYFIPSEAIKQALITDALRGVDVRLLLPGKSDNLLVTTAARSYYKALLDAGVRIFEYQRGFAHAKSMLIDSWMGTIGSANMDLRSFLLNFELNAFVFDEEFVDEMARQYLFDLSQAKEVDREAVRSWDWDIA